MRPGKRDRSDVFDSVSYGPSKKQPLARKQRLPSLERDVWHTTARARAAGCAMSPTEEAESVGDEPAQIEKPWEVVAETTPETTTPAHARREEKTEAAKKDEPPTEPAPEAPAKRPRGRPKGSKNKPKPAEEEETEEDAPVKRTRSTRAA